MQTVCGTIGLNDAHIRRSHNVMNRLPNYRKKMAEEPPADIHNNKGVDLCVQGHFDAGIAEFSKALRDNPKFPIAYFNRGIAFASLGLQKACVVDFETVTQLMQDFNEQSIQASLDPALIESIEVFLAFLSVNITIKNKLKRRIL